MCVVVRSIVSISFKCEIWNCADLYLFALWIRNGFGSWFELCRFQNMSMQISQGWLCAVRWYQRASHKAIPNTAQLNVSISITSKHILCLQRKRNCLIQTPNWKKTGVKRKKILWIVRASVQGKRPDGKDNWAQPLHHRQFSRAQWYPPNSNRKIKPAQFERNTKNIFCFCFSKESAENVLIRIRWGRLFWVVELNRSAVTFHFKLYF